MRDAALADAEGARAELRNNKVAYDELLLRYLQFLCRALSLFTLLKVRMAPTLQCSHCTTISRMLYAAIFDNGLV